jgi:hypothetical protein
MLTPLHTIQQLLNHDGSQPEKKGREFKTMLKKVYELGKIMALA